MTDGIPEGMVEWARLPAYKLTREHCGHWVTIRQERCTISGILDYVQVMTALEADWEGTFPQDIGRLQFRPDGSVRLQVADWIQRDIPGWTEVVVYTQWADLPQDTRLEILARARELAEAPAEAALDGEVITGEIVD